MAAERERYQDQLDTRAIEMASRALTKIEEHEKSSLVQHGQILGAIDALRSGVDKLFDRFWIASIAVIGLLLAIIGFFAADIFKSAVHPVQIERVK